MRHFLIACSLFLSVGMTVAPMPASAQCPMCRIGAESNLNNGGTAGQGLNKGILYLFATPYLIIGGLGYLWYRNRQQLRDGDDRAALN